MPGRLLCRGVAIGVAVCCACSTGGERGHAASRSPASAARLDSLLKNADAVYDASTDSAVSLWRRALSLADSLGDSASRAIVLTGFAGAAYRNSEYGDAQRLFNESIALKLRLGMRAHLFRSYNGLGLVANDEERYDDALRWFAKAAEAARDVGDLAGAAKASTNTGLALQDLGDFAGARAAYERGRDGTRAAGDSVHYGRALNNLAGLDIMLGDPVSALVSLSEARRLFATRGDSIGEMNARGQLATAYDALGEPQRAFALLDSGIALARRKGRRREVAQNLQIMGDLFWAARDSRQALDYYGRALSANDSLGLQEERGDVLRSMAAVHASSGSVALASQLARDALTVHRDAGLAYPELLDRLLLAELNQRSSRLAEAETQLRAAYAIAAKLHAELAKGLVALTEARMAAAERQWARTVSALDSARAAIVLAGADPSAEAMALRARALGRLGALDSAVATGRQAIAAVERVRRNYGSGELRTSYAAGKAAVYADQALLLLRAGRTGEAFDVADAARGRALLEHLVSARADIDTSSDIGMLLEREQLLRRIDALAAQLRSREAKPPNERVPSFGALTKGLTDSLARFRGEYESLLARSESGRSAAVALLAGTHDGARAIQRSLRPNEALLEYLVTPDEVLIFVVTPSGLALCRSKESATNLAARVELARELLGTGSGRARPDAVLRALHTVLLAPVQNSGALQHTTRIVVVPHGVLTYLPFAALIDPRTGKFVAQEYAILRVPTGASFAVLRRADTPNDHVQRDQAASVFAPMPEDLPATGDELVRVRAVLPRSTAHVGLDATEAAVRQSLRSGAIVHIATHALLNSGNPLFSRIELAGDPAGPSADNGRLEMHELLRLTASSPLVFLSGCETALGSAWSTAFETGEDYTTVAQAFLLAGAANVVATLWRIDDTGASVFASRFYEAALRVPPPEALAEAQRAMIADERYANPYYWAAYDVSGTGFWGR
jgi:CHAT domain-containing protein/tetratricopeptide (TPR) repeat protein